MFGLFKKKIKVVDVKLGKKLELATEDSVSAFFQKRMKNRIKKVLGYNWEICLTTDEWLYFGYIRGHKIPSQYVEQLFKVEKVALEKEFPGYEKITGQQVGRAVYQAIQDKRSLGNYTTLLQNIQWEASLQTSVIFVHVVWTYSTDQTPETQQKFELTFSKDVLDLMTCKEK